MATSFQSPSSGQVGDCSVTLKRRRVKGKTETLTMRGPCAGGKAYSTANAWVSLKKAFAKAQKGR